MVIERHPHASGFRVRFVADAHRGGRSRGPAWPASASGLKRSSDQLVAFETPQGAVKDEALGLRPPPERVIKVHGRFDEQGECDFRPGDENVAVITGRPVRRAARRINRSLLPA